MRSGSCSPMLTKRSQVRIPLESVQAKSNCKLVEAEAREDTASSCTSQHNQKSELIERASAIHIYCNTPSHVWEDKSTRATGRERRRAKLMYDTRGLYVDTKGAYQQFLINCGSQDLNTRP